MPTVLKNSFKDIEIHSLLGVFRRFLDLVLEDVKKAISKFALELEIDLFAH